MWSVAPIVALACAISGLAAQPNHFKVIANSGSIGCLTSPVVCNDGNHDSLQEFTFSILGPCRRIWRYSSQNCLESLCAIQGDWTYAQDEGYADRDYFTDRLETGADSAETMSLVQICESNGYNSLPLRIRWRWPIHPRAASAYFGYLPGDLDGDGWREVVCHRDDTAAIFIFENVGNNNYQPVWNSSGQGGTDGGAIAFGDFDQDGAQDFVISGSSWSDWVRVFECRGDNRYDLVFTDTITLPNGIFDIFSGRSVAQNGKPSFFINFIRYNGMESAQFYLTMWQAVGPDRYARICTDSSAFGSWYCDYIRSRCADVDGDSVEEVIQAAGSLTRILKYNDGRFHYVGYRNTAGGSNCINCADVNLDGYQEIITSHYSYPRPTTEVIEVEGVKVIRPNGGETYKAESTVSIHWETYHPPRCDSLSLFYSLDNGRNYVPIQTGIPGVETSFAWTIPDVHSDSCRIKAIAYGPGWLYDESDRCFRIASTGVEEEPGSVLETRLVGISPNPMTGQAMVRFQLRSQGRVELRVFDATGRMAGEIADRVMPPGSYSLNWDASGLSDGVYFLHFSAPNKKEQRKIVISRGGTK